MGTDFSLANNLVLFPFAKSICRDAAQVDSWPVGDSLGVRKIARLGARVIQDPVKRAEVVLACFRQQPRR